MRNPDWRRRCRGRRGHLHPDDLARLCLGGWVGQLGAPGTEPVYSKVAGKNRRDRRGRGLGALSALAGRAQDAGRGTRSGRCVGPCRLRGPAYRRGDPDRGYPVEYRRFSASGVSFAPITQALRGMLRPPHGHPHHAQCAAALRRTTSSAALGLRLCGRSQHRLVPAQGFGPIERGVGGIQCCCHGASAGIQLGDSVTDSGRRLYLPGILHGRADLFGDADRLLRRSPAKKNDEFLSAKAPHQVI